MSNTVPALEAIGLRKSYGDVVALHGLDLSIAKGEVFCLLGANGAGKTTTINLFLGFHRPDRGVARVDGVDVANNVSEARQRVAYIPEIVALYDKLTGLENLTFFCGLSGDHRPAEELTQLLIEAGLPETAHHKRVTEYSKGMRQKVGIAVAMAKNAQAILLDEPMSGLDPSAANALGEQIRQLRGAGCGVLMATHDIFRAKEIGDRIGIMMQGRLVNVIASDALNAKEIEAVYLAHLRDVELAGTAGGTA